MSQEDLKLYDFDMERLDWEDYFKTAMYGVRLYIGKEQPTAESIAKGLKLEKRWVSKQDLPFEFLNIFLQPKSHTLRIRILVGLRC